MLPVPVQWLVSRDGSESRLVIEMVRLVVLRSAEEIEAGDAERFVVGEGRLYLELGEQMGVELATVGFGDPGRWRARRMAVAIGKLLGGPKTIRFDGQEEVEPLPVS